MNRIPFDVYDFFGYLPSGLLVLVGMDLTLGFPRIIGQELKAVESAMLLMAIYVTGQIIATPAKAILEDGLIDKILDRPNVNLFREKKPPLLGIIFPGYYTPLPEQARKKIVSKIKDEGVMVAGEDMFLHARYSPMVLQDQKLMERLNTFLNKYGFNRNLSFSSLIVGIALLLKILLSPTPEPELLKYCITAMAAAILLLYRYLKFFRQYSYELFNTYGRVK